jgi:hypothetical protein
MAGLPAAIVDACEAPSIAVVCRCLLLNEARDLDAELARQFSFKLPEGGIYWHLSSFERQVLRALVLAYPDPLPVLTINLLREAPWHIDRADPLHALESHLSRLRCKLRGWGVPLAIHTESGRAGKRLRRFSLERIASA